MGLGADIWGSGTLFTGLGFALLIIPVFLYRHYVQDKGRFPSAFQNDLHLNDEGVVQRAGKWPYVVLAAGALVLFYSHHLASAG